ncbi:MAG TPA: YibE/F family protein [Candidatus Limnocylindrales bacterium]|nr:YibE/F family protein [Candidatus Limnocylindrales bacterium]
MPFAGLRRNARALLGGIAVVAGLFLLLPDLGPDVTASPVTLRHAVVVAILETGGDPALPDAEIRLLDGEDTGEVVGAYLQGPSGSQDVPRYEVGDEVVVSTSADTNLPDGVYVAVTDRWRAPVLALMVGLFALAVTLVGGWRGVRSLIALALTLAVVVRVIVPLILAGWSPVPVAVVAASAVTLLAVLLTEGLRPTSIAAVAGTFLSLALVGVLAVLFAALAEFTQLQGAGDIVFLQSIGLGDLDLAGILLAAVILGALGVLDDVSITQAAAVAELADADPRASRATIARRAMNVGRSHIAATVNTLVLAYVGASLPLLLLFAAGRQDPTLIASGEVVAVEVVRSLAGSIGIVAAVPLTTAIAVLLVASGGAQRGTAVAG